MYLEDELLVGEGLCDPPFWMRSRPVGIRNCDGLLVDVAVDEI
jgi:hypothetical protein